MAENVYLEIELERIGTGTWMKMRRELPEGTMHQDPSVEVHLDIDALRSTPKAQYGEALGRMLFDNPGARAFFSATRLLSKQGNYPLRVHVSSDPQDPTFTRIEWERLADPDTGRALAVDAEVSITRLVVGGEARPLPPVFARPLRALVAIAVPDDVETVWRLPAINRAAEVARIRSALHPIECVDISASGPVSLERLGEELRKGYDIAFVMCHGQEGSSGVRLLLEQNEAHANGIFVGSSDLSYCFDGPNVPRVVVFASCYSAASTTGPEDSPVRATIGAHLASAGVPVVVGISGSASIAGVAEFTAHFLRALAATGNVDRAVSAGRRAVRNKNSTERKEEEWSSMILFSRLKDGDVRWAPGAISARPRVEFEYWDELISSIRAARCVPVLGPGLLETMVGPLRDITRDLGKHFRYPLVEQQGSFPHVARYLETTLGRAGLIEHLRVQLREKALACADRDGIALADADRLDLLIAKAAAARRVVSDPTSVLVQLGARVYLTTDPFETLAEALRDTGRSPVVEYPRWRNEVLGPPSVWASGERFDPSPEKPLVYHLFGLWRHPESLVLTDDDLLEFNAAAHTGERIFPRPLRAILSESTFMFAGFRLEDIQFHMAYRSILNTMPQPGEGEPPHVAAQVEPHPSWATHVDVAERYLSAYFNRSAVTVLWGDLSQFADQLRTKLTVRAHATN